MPKESVANATCTRLSPLLPISILTRSVMTSNCNPIVNKRNHLGLRLRAWREGKKLALRQVAAAADMDSTVLSRIELGDRLPTPEQTAALARFFARPATELEAARIAEKFWKENRRNSAVAAAVCLIQEAAAEYRVNSPLPGANEPAKKA